MNLKYALKTASKGIKTNKSRSALTILGIVIGIAAVILIISLGTGAQNLILGQLQGMGSKTIVVLPGRQPKGPSDFAQTFTDSLKEKDLETLKKKVNVPSVEKLMPLVFGVSPISYENNTYRPTILGASENVFNIFNISPQLGDSFTEEDVKSRADVAIIGSKVKNELFGASNPIGEKIKIKNRNFRVIGVLPEKGQVSFFNFDEMALVPYTTAQQYLFGKKYFDRIVAEAATEKDIPQAVIEIKDTIRNSHNITDPEKDDFNIQTQADLVNSLSTITNILTLFLTAVAAISLVVGGIGIMNIMLVSVTERTREIGLRKALGATEKDILVQFLLESTLLTLLGGIIGIIIGTLFSFLISLILSKTVALNWQFTFPLLGTIIGLVVSFIIGIGFGLYPARKASSKSPIEALRYE